MLHQFSFVKIQKKLCRTYSHYGKAIARNAGQAGKPGQLVQGADGAAQKITVAVFY